MWMVTSAACCLFRIVLSRCPRLQASQGAASSSLCQGRSGQQGQAEPSAACSRAPAPGLGGGCQGQSSMEQTYKGSRGSEHLSNPCSAGMTHRLENQALMGTFNHRATSKAWRTSVSPTAAMWFVCVKITYVKMIRQFRSVFGGAVGLLFLF